MKTDTMKIRFMLILLISLQLNVICFSQEAGNTTDYAFDGEISEGVFHNNFKKNDSVVYIGIKGR
jgi:hypothetical protein